MGYKKEIEDFAAALETKFKAEDGNLPYDSGMAVEHGQRYSKLVNTRNGRIESVYAFVEIETGMVIKAAGYKAPQKDRDGLAYRASIATPGEFKAALERADRYGGWLYKKA